MVRDNDKFLPDVLHVKALLSNGVSLPSLCFLQATSIHVPSAFIAPQSSSTVAWFGSPSAQCVNSSYGEPSIHLKELDRML